MIGSLSFESLLLVFTKYARPAHVWLWRSALCWSDRLARGRRECKSWDNDFCCYYCRYPLDCCRTTRSINSIEEVPKSQTRHRNQVWFRIPNCITLVYHSLHSSSLVYWSLDFVQTFRWQQSNNIRNYRYPQVLDEHDDNHLSRLTCCCKQATRATF